MTAVAEVSRMKREEALLKLVCLLAAAGLFAFIAYNLIAQGSILSTDGLFFTVVPLMLAFCFLAVPGYEVLLRVLETRKLKNEPKAPPAVSGTGSALPGNTTPALKDAKGRTMPPDVSRMVAQMKVPAAKDQ